MWSQPIDGRCWTGCARAVWGLPGQAVEQQGAGKLIQGVVLSCFGEHIHQGRAPALAWRSLADHLYDAALLEDLQMVADIGLGQIKGQAKLWSSGLVVGIQILEDPFGGYFALEFQIG